MRTAQTLRVEGWLLGATVLLAFGLRVYRLAGQSIWYDEGLSVFYARQPLPELLALVSGSDHPPLYFLLLHVWLRIVAFGQPAVEFLVRYTPVIFGVLLVPLVYVFGRRLLSARAGLIAALLITISPFHVWYSQEARMYTLVVFLTLWAGYALWSNLQPFDYAQGRSRISNIQHPIPKIRFWHSAWYAYILTTTLALYAHFYAGFVLLAHAVFVTWWAWRRDSWRMWVRWTGASAVAVLIFVPWGGLVAGQLQANDTYWRGTLALGRTISRTAQAFVVGETIRGPEAILTTVAYLCLAAFGLLVGIVLNPGSGVRGRLVSGGSTSDSGPFDWAQGRLRTSDSAVFLLAYVLVPLIVLLAISYNRPKFAPRYLLNVTPALALLAGQGTVALEWGMANSRLRFLCSAAATVMVSVVLAGSGLSLWRHYTAETQFKADWRAAARYVGQHATPRDAVVIVAGHAMPAFDFYNVRQLDIYPLPPRLLPTVSDPMESGEVIATLNRLVREGHDRVWLILWQEFLADPRRLTVNQLFEYGRRLGVDQGFHDLGVLLFELPAGVVFGPLRPEHMLDAVYGRRLRLDGYDLAATSVAPGDTIVLRLYWRAVEPMSRDYTAFTQLLSAENRIVGQHDRRLGGDQYPTSRWPVGEPVRETYELTVQPDTPPGRYRLIAGAYLAPTGPRLLIQGDNMAGDHIVVGEIEVQR
ncbi:MAG: glycosyltransferase family 39 protein [Anaerolineae bacterium]